MFASITEIYCTIDDFCKHFDETSSKLLLVNDNKHRYKPCRMSLSEIMTIMVLFHTSHYRTFKDYYIDCIQIHLKPYFSKLVSYNRFVELMQSALIPLTIFLYGITGKETGIYFGDSTSIEVCHIKREKRHKVFEDFASKGKSSMGWFFGLKLHLIINNEGELMACSITQANVNDRTPVPKLVSRLKGWLFADKGYLGQPLIDKLKKQSIEIFTKVRKNMKERIITRTQKFLLSKRGIVETVIDQLKNCCQIEHSRHRSPINAFVNIISGLIAYCFKPKKPAIYLRTLTHQKLLLMSN